MIEEKAREVIKLYKMLENKSAIIIALSGGVDSSALTFFLTRIKDEYNLELFAAHINHGLRNEADEDEKCAKAFAEKLGLPFYSLKADIKSEARKTGESLEECGRRIRYNFLNKLSNEKNALIATAHNLNDSIETALFNMSRGSGLKGLCGIPPVRDNIIRPLIYCSRAEIETYCKSNSIKYVTDQSNFDNDYSRNKIRNKIIPEFYNINQAFDKTAARTLKNLRMDNLYLEKLADDAYNKTVSNYMINVKSLKALPSPIIPRIISRAAFGKMGYSLSSFHIDEIIDSLDANRKVQLPGNYFSRITNGNIEFFKRSQAVKKTIKPANLGKNSFYDYNINIFLEDYSNICNNEKVNKKFFHDRIDCDKISGSLILRNRAPGDKFSPQFRNITKTIKKLFNEAGIPPERRDLIPILCDDIGIIWISGFGSDRRVAADLGSKQFLRICEEFTYGE